MTVWKNLNCRNTDSHTSEICQTWMDSIPYEGLDLVSLPPSLFAVRSTTVPYFDDEWAEAWKGQQGVKMVKHTMFIV